MRGMGRSPGTEASRRNGKTWLAGRTVFVAAFLRSIRQSAGNVYSVGKRGGTLTPPLPSSSSLPPTHNHHTLRQRLRGEMERHGCRLPPMDSSVSGQCLFCRKTWRDADLPPPSSSSLPAHTQPPHTTHNHHTPTPSDVNVFTLRTLRTSRRTNFNLPLHP